ncbi:unnamed protein product [Caenorhabditis angaria]|uniref:DUF4440 domain-containing protein n=1 Tax=Caenorhabditis angaria TaxID=860376 RepID=A0A9P1ICQ0_9PELO|nr:unnamed protein product [Caenorhabditis angaria]
MGSSTSADLKKILNPYLEQYNRSTEAANAEESVKLLHPQAVCIERNKSATFGKEALLKLFKEWYEFTGPYIFDKYDEKYTAAGDSMIIMDTKMRLLKVKDKSQILKGEVMHIWKKENEKWYIFYEQFHVIE